MSDILQNSYMYGIDRDPVAIGIASQMAESQEYKNRLFPVIGRFSNMQPLLKSADVGYKPFVNGLGNGYVDFMCGYLMWTIGYMTGK